MTNLVQVADRQIAFEVEVADRFGVLPNFFQTASDAPGLISELWSFAKSAYLDNPLPSLFKERLFVHLSRFCQVRYCIIRHVGFLAGYGRPSGDRDTPPQTLDEIANMLAGPGYPTEEALTATISRLKLADFREMPQAGSEAERDVFAAATVLFLEPHRAAPAKAALRAAMGGAAAELLTAFLAFIRTAHYWTITHPELTIEDDMKAMLATHERLANLLLNDPEAARGATSQRMVQELEELRREQDDRETLREALAAREEAQRHQQLLINELNHRVKNSLALVQSIASQTLRQGDVPATVRESFIERLVTLGLAHDLLTAENWDGADLSSVLTTAGHGFATEEGARITLSGPPVRLSPSQALALSLATYELATNATKYGSLSNDTGLVSIIWTLSGDAADKTLNLLWRETGGPPVVIPTKKGFGTRLIERGLAGDLDGNVSLTFEPDGVICTVDARIGARATA